MKLADKFTEFRALLPTGMDRKQALYTQACYLSGARAVFELLADASGESQEDAIRIWQSVQQEIKDAAVYHDAPPATTV